jgi:pimeloyl-ACP methyl ester carboxylesterase
VVALDLSGHGDSGRRPSYDTSIWAREVAAVAEAENLDRPVVIGHSLGGWVALTVGAEHPGATSAVAVIDSPLFDQPPEGKYLRRRQQPSRAYPTVEEAVTRFRTAPTQDVVLPYVRDHVARSSLRRDDDGWRWKFDPQLWGAPPLLAELLPQVTCPAALFRCEKGLVSRPMADQMAELFVAGLPVVDIPDAGHHPIFDQPLALVTGIRTLLTFWPHLGPQQR